MIRRNDSTYFRRLCRRERRQGYSYNNRDDPLEHIDAAECAGLHPSRITTHKGAVLKELPARARSQLAYNELLSASDRSEHRMKVKEFFSSHHSDAYEQRSLSRCSVLCVKK